MNQTNGHTQTSDELTRTAQNGKTAAVKTNENRESGLGFLSPITSDQAVILRQSPSWSRGVVWTIVGVTTASLIWAAIASIEQVVLAKGQLKPQGTVKEIQSPVDGVVKEVYVEDGDRVKKGQVLLTLDSTATAAELTSLQKVKQALNQENQFYRSLMQHPLDPTQVERAIIQLKIPREVAALARNRTALMAENQLYQLQLGNSVPGSQLPLDQVARLQSAQAELFSREMAARLEMEQQQRQLRQAQIQLADARTQLLADRQVLATIKARNEQAMDKATKGLAIEQSIFNDVEPLLEEGALARLQVERQRQSILDRVKQIVEQEGNGKIEHDKQQQQVENRQAEIQRLQQEVNRLELVIARAHAQMTNTVDISEKEVSDRLADNKKRLAEIDSQLTKILVDNDKRVSELDSQISRAQVTLKYQAIKSPVNGTIFDLKATPGYVPPPSQSEPMLKIVPDDLFVAEVDITNEDIGFVRVGQKADVRLDSFPFSEFGDIKGQVKSIGSDALPPDEINRFYRFPAKIQLDQQFLDVNGQEMTLQSGMSISVNIKVRENRTVLSLFTELFTDKVESLKQVR